MCFWFFFWFHGKSGTTKSHRNESSDVSDSSFFSHDLNYFQKCSKINPVLKKKQFKTFLHFSLISKKKFFCAAFWIKFQIQINSAQKEKNFGTFSLNFVFVFLIYTFFDKFRCPVCLFYCVCQVILKLRFPLDPFITPRTEATLIWWKKHMQNFFKYIFRKPDGSLCDTCRANNCPSFYLISTLSDHDKSSADNKLIFWWFT